MTHHVRTDDSPLVLAELTEADPAMSHHLVVV